MSNTTRHIPKGYSCKSDRELFYTIGVGTGATADQLLQLTSDDIKEGYIFLHVGPLQIGRTYNLPEDVIEALKEREGQLFSAVPEGISIDDFLPLTMKQYYKSTGDLVYPTHIMGLKDEEEAKRIMGC